MFKFVKEDGITQHVKDIISVGSDRIVKGYVNAYGGVSVMKPDIEITIRLVGHSDQLEEADARGMIYCATDDWITVKSMDVIIDAGAHDDVTQIYETLAHEMIHVGQWITGRMVRGNVWCGVEVNADYDDQPWEIEAHTMERRVNELSYGKLRME